MILITQYHNLGPLKIFHGFGFYNQMNQNHSHRTKRINEPRMGRPYNDPKQIAFIIRQNDNRQCIELSIELMITIYLRFFKRKTVSNVSPESLKEFFVNHEAEKLYDLLLSPQLLEYNLSPYEQVEYTSITDIQFLTYYVKSKLNLQKIATVQIVLFMVAYLKINSMMNPQLFIFCKKLIRNREFQKALESKVSIQKLQNEKISDASSEKLIVIKMARLVKWVFTKFEIKMQTIYDQF